MVLFKRKPVTFLSPPKNISENTEVWSISASGEVFVTYEEYIKRYEYLRQKKFTDAVNGKSGLTFFQALLSETNSTTAIENVFPEVLRDPILRKVQFATTGRMDDLVNQVYDEFKRDFFPGEEDIVLLEDGEQLEGVIREKAKFPMIRGPDGQVQRAAFSRYFVTLNSTPAKEALLDDKHVRRDRKVFTKQNLRSFLKNSLQRESWIGAPWLVKEHLAIQYRLPMEIPAHLLQDARLLANRVWLSQQARQSFTAPQQYPAAPHANVFQQQMLQMKAPRGRGRSKHLTPDEFARLPPEEQARYQMQAHHGAPPNGQFRPQPIASRMEPPKPPPIVIKYPIEDLDIAPKRNGVTRPELKFFTDEMADYIRNGRRTQPTTIAMKSMGELLEVWNTLNVQCEVYVLDSFTFDDFVDALQFSATDMTCELLDEIHCAVLKQLVDEKGKIHVSLPSMADEESEESETPQDESEVSTPVPDVPARSTRSRLSHVDPAVENSRSPTVSVIPNRATEMLAGKGWIERLTAREFEDGGWQVILVGVLHQLASVTHLKLRCEKILAQLAPMDGEPTPETARFQYASMDMNLRISALQIVTILSVTTRAIKDFMETCSEDQTDVRKRKIEHQRERKIAMENLQIKDRERKILLPDNMPPSPKDESIEPTLSANGEGDDTLETNGDRSSVSDQEATNTRSLRRAGDRKRKRDEENARREEEAKRKAEAAKAQNKQSKEFQKILRDIELLRQQIIHLEAKIAECDADLREANVQRTKVLGKDRFCNRYYWFERNGQPFGGLPSSSTAEYGYANGRIWVQGPDKMEADGFINRSPEEQTMYRQHFGLTTHERRKLEEGNTILNDAEEWGYYDDPSILDNLIGWLDDRGEREKKLRRELFEWRDTVATYMEAHKKFKEEAAKKHEVDEEQATRISTRHKTYEDRAAAGERCLKWHNGMAEEQLGHLHSQNPPKPKEKKAKSQPKGVATLVNRHGKPTTRQGDSYNFNKR